MKNQVIYVSPSIEEARVRLFNFLFDFEKVVANQKRLEYTINSVISCFFHYHKPSFSVPWGISGLYILGSTIIIQDG